MKNFILNTNQEKLMIFNRWTGKNYSVFSSLGKLIKVSVLSVAYFSLNVFLVQAQKDTIKIDEITVNAYRTPVSMANLARMVTSISADEITEAPITSLNDALKSVMNVDIRERGTYGVQADINFRGGSFEQNVVLLNGVKMNDPQTGHFQLNLPIDLPDIDKIEIIHGGASSVFGNNAFSGAINLITGLKDRNGIKASVIAGEHGLLGTSIALNLSNRKIINYLSVSKKISDGYIKNTDFDIFNFFYNGRLITNVGELQFQAGFLDKSFGANSFYTPVYPNQFEQNKTWMSNLKYSSDTRIKFNSSVYWRRNFDRFELFRSNPPIWYTNHNYHQTDVYGLDLNTQFDWILGKSSIGLDWNTESILSNKLGEPLDDVKPINGLDSVAFEFGKSRQNISAFFENHFKYNKFGFSTSFMLNWNSMFNWNLYPGLDVSYRISDNWHSMFSVNWSGRVPSFTDLYYVGPGNEGNLSLKPEKSINYELGAKYITNQFVLQTALFYRMGYHIIDWVKLEPGDLWKSNNITSINTFGLEINSKIFLNKIIGDKFPVKYIIFNYSYIDMGKNQSTFTSKYVLDYLRHNAGFTLYHQIVKNLSASWQFNFQYRNGSYLPYNNELQIWEPALNYKPVFLFDGRISYKIGVFESYIQLKNIFDQMQQNVENVQLPGRWFSGGISVNLSFVNKMLKK